MLEYNIEMVLFIKEILFKEKDKDKESYYLPMVYHIWVSFKMINLTVKENI